MNHPNIQFCQITYKRNNEAFVYVGISIQTENHKKIALIQLSKSGQLREIEFNRAASRFIGTELITKLKNELVGKLFDDNLAAALAFANAYRKETGVEVSAEGVR